MGMTYGAAAITPAQIAQVTADPDPDDILDLIDDGIDLGKLFMEVQLLISGDVRAPGPVFAGEPVGEDLGFGPAVLVGVADVARIAGDLDGLTRVELESRFSPELFDGPFSHPDMFTDNPDGGVEELTSAAMSLVELYRRAADAGHGIVYAIT